MARCEMLSNTAKTGISEDAAITIAAIVDGVGDC